MPKLDDVVAAAEKLLSPAAPGVVARLGTRVADLHGLERAVAVDPLLTVKVLSFANSSFYARQAPVSGLRQALVRIGWEAARELLLRLILEKVSRDAGPAARPIWEHATRMAVLSRILARIAGTLDPSLAYTAGLTSNLGQMGMLAVFRDPYVALLEDARTGAHLAAQERDRWKLDHSQVGAGVLARLEAPADLAEAVRRQYRADLAKRSWEGDASLPIAAVVQLSTIVLMDNAARMGRPDWIAALPLAQRLPLAERDLVGLPDRFTAALESAVEGTSEAA